MMFDLTISSIYEKIATSGIAILLVYFLTRLVIRLLNKWVNKPDILYSTTKKVIYGSTVIGVIVVVTIWTEFFSGITTFLGIIGAGIALALKDPLTSIAGWLYLAVSKAYQLGDRIEIDGLKGDVVDISVFHTTLLEVEGWVDGEQSTGRLSNIPHNWLFTKKLFNYTNAFRFIWTEVSVVITFESDWKKARDIVIELAKEVSGETPQQAVEEMRASSNKYLIKIGAVTPIAYITVVDHGVKITARLLTPVRSRRSLESSLYRLILEAFDAESDIALAYLTYRIVKEGL